jgi:small subunit ribosomal protein S16
MVKVRLARAGSKGRPYYHIVVADIESPRDGRFIEQLGTYDPAKPEANAKLDHERLAYWTGVGAQVSDRVAKIARELAKAAPAAETPAS